VKPVLLDLFCKAGGCTKGYQRAGFTVIGVDIEPQPRYVGDGFILADALDIMRRLIAGEKVQDANGRVWKLGDFAVIHASPPCEFGTQLQALAEARNGTYPDHVNLIPDTRNLLLRTGLPYIIEMWVGQGENCKTPSCYVVSTSVLRYTVIGILKPHQWF
jgi:DNA (cytosine-5)-methyltransferase 1